MLAAAAAAATAPAAAGTGSCGDCRRQVATANAHALERRQLLLGALRTTRRALDGGDAGHGDQLLKLVVARGAGELVDRHARSVALRVSGRPVRFSARTPSTVRGTDMQRATPTHIHLCARTAEVRR